MTVTQSSLAAAVAHWLRENGCTVTTVLSFKKGGDFEVHYTLRNDVRPQPAVRITSKPSVVFPVGSQESIVVLWLEHCAKS